MRGYGVRNGVGYGVLSATNDSLRRLLGGIDLAAGDHTKTVFLSGSGRSGTTWLSGLLNHDAAYREVFEPFHPGKVAGFRHFRSKQYLRPEDRREAFLEPARKAVSGRLWSRWSDRGGALVARRRLVKEIRANLLLGWLAENFPGMPIVLLMRHPCAVVSSRLALGWQDNLDETISQRELVEDHLLPVERRIRAARDPFERHLFLWCIDNYVPLRQFQPGDIHLVFYENLVREPGPELRRLFRFVGRDYDDRVLLKLGRPSRTSRRDGDVPSVDGWRGRVGEERLEKTVEILSLFGLDGVYGQGPEPDPAKALALMGVAERRGGA